MKKESEEPEHRASEVELAALGINQKELEEEQKKFANEIKLEDIDTESLKTIGGCYITYIANKIIVAIVVMDRNYEIIEEKFVYEKASFPYFSGFLSYRELPVLMKCWQKLTEIPDVLIVNRNGILHPRKFGLASQFGLSINKPTIGIANKLLCGENKKGKIYLKKDIIGEEVQTKIGSRPIYVSPGHLISLKSSVELVKALVKEPHKLPEPLDAANRYANKIKEEFLKVRS
jgi:deoxyribonuclease V